MKLRIVRRIADDFEYYVVEVWTWYWPFWTTANFVNLHTTVKDAEKFAENYRNPVVKYL